ncbi:hypothetical protein [Streptomyces sp. NBC_01217]|uniref:hypothetical protein n=1 Tax=Streptomyces sp. NBC_01217 TaxID=2903779 RepID=UPI003FA382E3
MPNPPVWSRRTLLAVSTATALALSLPASATAADAAEADEFDTLRLRWVEIALGTGFDAAAEPYASRLAQTGALAREFRAAMSPAADSLWPGFPYNPPSGTPRATAACGR